MTVTVVAVTVNGTTKTLAASGLKLLTEKNFEKMEKDVFERKKIRCSVFNTRNGIGNLARSVLHEQERG